MAALMELVFAAVGLWLLFCAALSWALGRAAALGDRAWREALWLEEQREPEWNWPEKQRAA